MKKKVVIYPAVYTKSAVSQADKVGCLTATYAHNFDGFGTRAHVLEYEEVLPNISNSRV